MNFLSLRELFLLLLIWIRRKNWIVKNNVATIENHHQKLPLDKNGDLIFDVDEARDIHNNAVAMLKRAIGVDVLTTFADIEKLIQKTITPIQQPTIWKRLNVQFTTIQV